jgi:branched-subunit amino acid aminotransferase/4-amino-4-deoxychorismate lyase
MLNLLDNTNVNLEQPDVRHGFGLFETVRIANGIPLRLDEHLARLAAGAKFLGIGNPPNEKVILDFLVANTNCRLLSSGVLRLVAIDNNLHIMVSAWTPALPKIVTLGISNDIVRFTRNRLNNFKTTSYIENRLMMQEAERRNLYEVIAINENGYLADGSRTNLFLVINELLVTPPITDGALPGIARKALLDAKLAIEISISEKDINNAQAVILTNALHGAISVNSFYGDRINKLNNGHYLVQKATTLLKQLSN